VKINKITSSIKEVFITIGWLMIPIFQYVPCVSIWFGIMSLPLIGYLFFFISTPTIAGSDFEYFFGYGFPWSIIAIISGIFFLFCLGFQLINRKKLIIKGPYKYSRHPQYLAIIIMTFSLSMISLNTSPINPFSSNIEFSRILIFFIWFIETFAYILLAKLEEFWLEKKYAKLFHEYKKTVSFMLPFINLTRKSSKNEKILE
jgi:protein-S-isoprenylcysteine O-methyltransferase Ste14